MMDVVHIGAVAAYLYYYSQKTQKKKRKSVRRWWVHPIMADRLTTGQFHLRFCEHRKFPEKFFLYYRMSIKSFDELLAKISNRICKNDTVMRRSIGASERLVITLRYLATGSNFTTLEYTFHVSKSTIRVIVRETCIAIWEVWQPIELPRPTKETWLKISNLFYKTTNFPNCLGAIDGKHIRIMCPRNSGSEYFNYKKYFSIVLLAVVDADYCFTAVDVGSYGRESDSNIFKSSNFGKLLQNNALDLPEDSKLPGSDSNAVPYVFVGDEAFGLMEHVLRPYPRRELSINERVFNYRLTRARRMVECTFGILANKWRVFHTSLLVDEDFADDIIKAACVLHNFVRRRDGYDFKDTLTHPLEDIEPRGTGGPSLGVVVRNKFKEYFVSPAGEIPWQYSKI